MPLRYLTQEDYDALVRAYRKCPANFAQASRLAGVCRPTARRYWFDGMPKRNQKPIKDLLEEEAAEVRRRMDEMAKRERELEEREKSLVPRRDAELERQDAIKRREEWALASGAARRNVQAMLVSVGQLLAVAYAKAGVVREELVKAELPPLQWVRIIRDLVQTGRMVHEAMHMTLQTEHLALGAPTAIVGVQHSIGSVSLEDAERELAAANAALMRMRHKRASPSLPGVVIEAEVEPDTSVVPLMPEGKPTCMHPSAELRRRARRHAQRLSAAPNLSDAELLEAFASSDLEANDDDVDENPEDHPLSSTGTDIQS